MAEVIILDHAIQPKEPESTKPIIKETKATFTYKTGSILEISMAEYEIKTDVSFLPWKDEETDEGIYFYESQSYGTVYDPIYNYLINSRILFASKTLKVERSLGKIDNMLSYVGGLFAIILGFFTFFLSSYN